MSVSRSETLRLGGRAEDRQPRFLESLDANPVDGEIPRELFGYYTESAVLARIIFVRFVVIAPWPSGRATATVRQSRRKPWRNRSASNRLGQWPFGRWLVTLLLMVSKR
jgi:hypothetical protein